MENADLETRVVIPMMAPAMAAVMNILVDVNVLKHKVFATNSEILVIVNAVVIVVFRTKRVVLGKTDILAAVVVVLVVVAVVETAAEIMAAGMIAAGKVAAGKAVVQVFVFSLNRVAIVAMVTIAVFLTAALPVVMDFDLVVMVEIVLAMITASLETAITVITVNSPMMQIEM